MKNIIALLTVAFLSLPVFANEEGIDPSKKVFEKWSKRFIAYPESSTVQQEQGVVYVSFEIADDGSANQIMVEAGISEALDQKAVEVVEAMPKEHLYANGFIEGTRFILPIKFEIQ